MLVLSRREGETILVGDEIEITITRIKGDRVIVGIVAPQELRILRSELEKHDENLPLQND